MNLPNFLTYSTFDFYCLLAEKRLRLALVAPFLVSLAFLFSLPCIAEPIFSEGMKLRIVNDIYLGPDGSVVKVANIPEKLKGENTTTIRIRWTKIPDSRFIPKGAEYVISKVKTFVPENVEKDSELDSVLSVLRYAPKPAYVEIEFASGPFKSMRFGSTKNFVLPTFSDIQQRFAGIFHFYTVGSSLAELTPNGYVDPLADGRQNNAIRGLCKSAWNQFKNTLDAEDKDLADATTLSFVASSQATLANSNIADGVPIIEISDGFLNEVWSAVYILSQPGHPDFESTASRQFSYCYNHFTSGRTSSQLRLKPKKYAETITTILSQLNNSNPGFRDSCYKSALIFVLAHEFGHIRKNDPSFPASSKVIARTRERKADEYAIESMMNLKLCPLAALFSINSVTTLESSSTRGVFLYPSLASRAKMILRGSEFYFSTHSSFPASPMFRLTALEKINELLYLVQINLDAQEDDSYL